MDSSANTMMHAVRGYFRFPTSTAPSRPTPPYTRRPKIHRDESRTQGLGRLELIRFLQSPRPSLSTTARWFTCSSSTPYAPPRP